jgi:hypothetical protein
VAAVFGFRLSWNTYVRLFPRLPNQARYPVAFYCFYTLKLLIFGLLLPLSAVWVTLFVLIGGGWSRREQLFEFFWSLFLKPWLFLATVVTISFQLIVGSLFIFGSFLPLVAGLTMLALSGGQVIYVIAGVILTAGGAWALIAIWRRKPIAMAEALMMFLIERISNVFVRMAVLALPAATVAASIAFTVAMP